MPDRKLIAHLGMQIPPTAIRDYAKSRKWLPVEGSRRRLWIFRHTDSELRQLIVPMDRDAAWTDALGEIVLRLAETEKRPFEAILNDLLTVYADVVRFRVGSEDTSAGMLPMADASGLIDGAKRALTAAACSVINKVTHHPRMSRSEAEEFMRVCKMGQTEIGSYVVKVICPINEMEEPPLLQEAQPFAREATTILMKGCEKIVRSVEQDKVDEMLDGNTRSPEVTSNLCDALLRMHAAREKADLTIEISWSGMPKLPVPNLLSRASFKPEYFKTVEEIQRHLRPQTEQDEELPLFGTVETLNGDVGEDGRRSGEVAFALLLPDEEIVRARGNLSADDYEKAVHAHKVGRGYVSFTGSLKRGVRIGCVERITGFRALSSESTRSDLPAAR